MNKTPSEMTQQELYLELARLTNENDKLKRTKKFGLVWENKNDAKVEEVRRSAPILVEDSTKRVINDPNDVNHVLINGDNFQAMTALRATHAGKVDVIYIDPPYNTGNKDFIYNDNYLDKEDGYRHSKWLSFMQKRLILAKELLSETGVIFVSIDDNEQARLKLLMDEVFGASNVEEMIWHKISEGGSAGSGKMKITHRFRRDHEYILVAYKHQDKVKFAKPLRLKNFKNEYPNLDNDKRGNWVSSEICKSEEKSSPTGKNYYEIVTPQGKSYMRQWHVSKGEFNRLDADGRIWWGKGETVPRLKKFVNEPMPTTPTSIYSGVSQTDGNNDLKAIGMEFDNPKPLDLIKWLIEISGIRNSVVLDFFAGSGTTAHAVAELNKADGGKRQCILITDGGKTETSGESSKNANENAVNIAEEITYERVKRVLTGKGWADGKEHEPLGGNLFYLNTVVKYVGTIDAKSKEPYFCPSNSTAFSLDTGLWHPILEKVGVSAEYPHQEHDYKLFALPKGEDGKQNYALTINATDWEFTAFKEWFDKNMPEDSTVFLYADNYSHGGCEWMEELEMAKDPRLETVNITKRLVNNHNWVAHSCLKTDI